MFVLHVSYEISKVIFDLNYKNMLEILDHITSVVYYIAVNFRLCAMVRDH